MLAAPRSLSQRTTSFIACVRQGIHRMPLRHLITPIANARPEGSQRQWICINQRSSRRCPTTGARPNRGTDVRCGQLFLFTMSNSRPGALGLPANRNSAALRRWWSQTGSNRRPPACKAGALPTELWPRSRGPGPPVTVVGRQVWPLMAREARPGVWWAWVDSNYRPHAYQACALTT